MEPLFYYADYIELPLPVGHRFPADKYQQTRNRLIAELGIAPDQFSKSPLATKEQLALAHSKSYIEAVFAGDLAPLAIKKIGFPWSKELVQRCLASTGGTLASARSALANGYSAQLAGGTHHAHYNFGAGYCVFNDFAVTAQCLLTDKAVRRIAIIDLDVHHGDGNAILMGSDPNIFILNMHGEKNYPLKKPPSDLDIPLADNTNDQEFIHRLTEALPEVAQFTPDIILYQAGVDALAEDRLGRLALTHAGLKRRDEIVFSFAKEYGIAITHVLGGGYCRPIHPTVEAYINTFRAAKEVFEF